LAKTTKGKTPENSNAARMINILLVVGALIITSGIIWYAMKGPGQTAQREALPKPNVTTLDPMLFSGKTRKAYEAAREVPEVLAKLPCFCGCMSGFGHRNNLDCFHDEHGVECSMCQDIALEAREMYKNGYDIERIRKAIKDKYDRSAALVQ
jgi:Protein of unknown function with PCYCGC motif